MTIIFEKNNIHELILDVSVEGINAQFLYKIKYHHDTNLSPTVFKSTRRNDSNKDFEWTELPSHQARVILKSLDSSSGYKPFKGDVQVSRNKPILDIFSGTLDIGINNEGLIETRKYIFNISQ